MCFSVASRSSPYKFEGSSLRQLLTANMQQCVFLLVKCVCEQNQVVAPWLQNITSLNTCCKYVAVQGKTTTKKEITKKKQPNLLKMNFPKK